MLKSEEFDEKKFLEAEIERLYASIEAERRIIKNEKLFSIATNLKNENILSKN